MCDILFLIKYTNNKIYIIILEEETGTFLCESFFAYVYIVYLERFDFYYFT